MEKINPAWSKFGIVTICEKCGKKLSVDNVGLNPAVMIKDEIKKTLINENLWGEIRVLNSTCLDICPDQKIAVSVLKPNSEPYALIFDPKTEKQKLLETIRHLATDTTD